MRTKDDAVKQDTQSAASSSGGSSGGGSGSKTSVGASYNRSSSGSSAKAGAKAGTGAKVSAKPGAGGSIGKSIGKSSGGAKASLGKTTARSGSSGSGRNKSPWAQSTRSLSVPASKPAGTGIAPAWVGKNPYQWGNTKAGTNHREPDAARQKKLDALGFAADDPDRTFHYYVPNKGSDQSYLAKANNLSEDRNYYMAGHFWDTINGTYASEDDRVADAMEWMKDAQIYGAWARENNLTYKDKEGNELPMEDEWKRIWSYANDIAGGVGDSDSTRTGKDIQAYLAGEAHDSETTKRLLEQAKQFSGEAETDEDLMFWTNMEMSLNDQLKADEKQEKRDGSFFGKAGNLWDSFTGMFERPERNEQGELTDTQKAYQQAAAEEQMYSGWATDPLSAAAFAPVAERRDELAAAVKDENREAGREVYAGMAPEDRLTDMTESWLGGRGAGSMAGVAGGLYAVDSMFYDNDEIRELTQRKFIADQNLLTTGDQKFREESDALQAQIDDAQRRAIENGENGTALGDAAGMLLDSAMGMQNEADQKWTDATEDLSAAEQFGLNVLKTGADVAADIGENAVAPGVGTLRMYLGAAGGGAMEQAGRENNDPDSIAAAAVTRGLSAYLSTKLVGGMESAYGQSLLGGLTDDLISAASPGAQAAFNTLLNTEGVEEGLEDILNYGADLILGLDEAAQLNWNDVKQDAFIGYVVGVLTNGLSAGINYDGKARKALAEEAFEFAQSGLSIEEAANIGMDTTKGDVVMKPRPESDNQAAAASQSAALEGQDTNPQAAPPADLQAAAAAGTNAAWNQEAAASQNAAIEGQNQNVTPAPENVNNQDTSVTSQVTPEQAAEMAQSQTAALEGQGTNPQAAPAQQTAQTQQATTASGPAADTTKPYEGPTLPGASYGGATTVKVGNTKIPVHFAVVPISELNVSHDIYGNQNENYPSELQPRDRSRGTAQNQAIQIGTNLDPGELEWSNNATTGAPVIRPDGTVISGNGRTLGIGYAMESGRGAAYTQHLQQEAARLGLDPNSIGEDSVLVRVADGDYNWQAMAEQSNVSDVSRMSATEQAGVDAERLSRYPEILSKLVPNDTGDLNNSDNAEFVKDFLQAVVPESEQGDVWTEEGGFSQSGMRRVQNAIFQMAYGDSALMARLGESLDNNMKNVSNAMLALAPKVAALENNVANGTRYIGVRDAILDGVKIFETAKNRGVEVGKVVDQISMDRNASAEAVFIAEFLQDNAKSAKQIRTFMNDMADTAESFGDPTQIGFFDTGETEHTSRDVLEGAIAKYEQETGRTIGRPDYDFYGDGSDVFNLGTDSEGESRTSAEADANAGGIAENPGEAAGSGADERVREETGKVRKEVLRSFTQKGIERTFKRGDMEIAKGAVKAQNPQEYIDYNAKSNAQRVRLTKWLAAVQGNPALLLAESDTDRAVMLQMAMSDEWMYDSGAVLFRLMADRPADGGQDQFKLTEWAEKNGITAPEDVEYLRSKLHGLSTNYPGLLNYSNSLNFDSVTLRSIDDIQDTLEAIARRRVGAAEPEASPVSENPLADIAEESAQLASAAQPDETVVDNLLGEEPEAASEPATEPAAGAQENPAGVNSQPGETNAPETVLNAQAGRADANPLAEIAEETAGRPAAEPAQAGNPNANPNANPNVNENVDTEANAGGANPNANTNTNPDQENPNIPLKDLPRKRKGAKISQYFTNTLTESGRARGVDPITYNPTSEAESLTRAAMRMADDKMDLLDQLMNAPAWDNEMVDAAWLFENELYKQYLRTGDSKDLNAWKRIQTYKISQTAKGLQAVAKQSRPTAAAVLEASMNQIEDFKANAKPGDQKAQQAAAKAEKDLNSAVRDLGTIENAIDDLTSSGMSETEARETLKGDLIDLSVKINQMRGVSMFGDMGNRKQQKKFRKLLGEEDAGFIQRFVACQAAGIAEDVAYKGKQDIGAQLNTFQKLAQLTGTGTWLRNLSGNASFGLIDILAADNPVTLVADQIMKAATGQRSTGFELGMMDKGVLAASKRAWNRSLLEVAANIDLAENQENTKYDMSRTRTNDPTGNLMRRALSRWEQWNGYMLTSSDKLFRGGIEQSVTNAIARANGWDVNKLTAQQKAQIRETAEQVASYRLFQNQGIAAKLANFARDAFNLNFPGTDPAKKHKFGFGTMLTPYTTVPTNIGVKALEFSPANAVKGLVEMVKVASDAKNGTATMAKQNQAVTDLGRGVTGTALIAGLAVLMKNWPFFKDWENEDDKDVKQQNKSEGKQGMQFNLSMIQRYANGETDATWRNDDRTIDISSIEPLNQLLTAASLISDGEDFDTAVLTSARENFMQLPSISALANIENTYRYTDTPDDIKQTLKTTAASMAGGIVGGFIPAPVRHVASVTDESERDTSGNNQAERALNQIKSGIPGLRQTLPVKTDNYGNEVSAGDVGTRILNTYGGQRYTQINQSDISREAERLREATGIVLTPGRNGPSSEKFSGEKVKLTAEQRRDWKDDYGQDLSDTVNVLMRSGIYKSADDDTKTQLWDEIADYARDGVKTEFAKDNDLKYDAKYGYLDDAKNPITFLTAKKAFSIAEENGQWDLVDSLIGPVGKLTPEEQDLMRDKDRTLMNYYDYLTPNARGYKVKDAATLHDYKEKVSANAEARGKTSPSEQDKYNAVVEGYRNKTYTDADVDAFMTKQASDGDWEVTKGRAALYLAARAGGASVRDAIIIINNADKDGNGQIDEKGFTMKAKHEGSNALKRSGVKNSGAMWNAFNEIMYPWKVS